MTDITPRRRWLGRTTIAAAALIALPLTASVSYAVVQAEPPAPPAPPAAPGAPNVIISSEDAPHERRIEQNGRTIILRTTQPLSDAEVERLVAEAETAAGAEATAAAVSEASADGRRREIHRIVIRNHGSGDAAMPVPPVPPVPPADGERRVERRIMMVNQGAVTVRCSAGADAAAAAPSGGWQSADGRQVNVVACTETPAALRLQAVRSARAALVAMSETQLPAEARRSALAELDGIITTLEREVGN